MFLFFQKNLIWFILEALKVVLKFMNLINCSNISFFIQYCYLSNNLINIRFIIDKLCYWFSHIHYTFSKSLEIHFFQENYYTEHSLLLSSIKFYFSSEVTIFLQFLNLHYHYYLCFRYLILALCLQPSNYFHGFLLFILFLDFINRKIIQNTYLKYQLNLPFILVFQQTIVE